jgi:dGTPase
VVPRARVVRDMNEVRLPAGYTDSDAQRWVDEPPKRVERSPFARDRARVVHSSALRRLAAKTQVVGPGTDDFHRNRLTHTLEVAQVGRELATSLGCDPDVVETACLAHDIGHPPFGHNGEVALDAAAAAYGGFEGNAQTLRILTRLEAKTWTAQGETAGLNLTRACLDAACKYPWVRGESPGQSGKFGVYADDLPVFIWLRKDLPTGHRCLEAQVMDLADDIAYSVHDVEDGVVAGRIDLAGLADPGRRSDVWAVTRDWYLPAVSDEVLEEAIGRVWATPGWPGVTYTGSRRAQSTLKNLTSGLIGRFCRAAEQATRTEYGPHRLARYTADLVVPDDTRAEIAALKGIAAHYIMRAADRVAGLAREREVISDLVALLRLRSPGMLEPAFRDDFETAGDEAARLRVIIDQIASLTDASALAWHVRLTA